MACKFGKTVMKDRIKQLMDSRHMTQQEFSEYINIAPATLSSIFRGRTRPTLSIVDAVKNRFPEVSTDWLLFGKEPMFVNAGGGEGVSGSSSDGVADGVNVTSDAEIEPSFDFMAEPADDYGNVGGNASAASAPFVPKPATRPVNGQTVTVKNIDRKQRSITEIRIFYDDQTWETFVPKAK